MSLILDQKILLNKDKTKSNGTNVSVETKRQRRKETHFEYRGLQGTQKMTNDINLKVLLRSVKTKSVYNR